MKADSGNKDLGRLIKRQRVTQPLTLREMADLSGISASHLGRIERGERFPSAYILRKIARPLAFDESELFTLAGYLSPLSTVMETGSPGGAGRLDTYVASMLRQEPLIVQRSVIGLLSILKNIARSV
ncbi:helix-turn-helix domain-containing protein [Chloroflexota bacterium]